MDSIALIIAIVIGCLIPVATGILVIAEVKAGGGKPEFIEVWNVFCILLAWGVVLFIVLCTVSNLVYVQLT
jgi:hypothetical protein